jgi:hypothetical protein
MPNPLLSIPQLKPSWYPAAGSSLKSYANEPIIVIVTGELEVAWKSGCDS